MTDAFTYTFTAPDYQETTVDLLNHVLGDGIGTIGVSSVNPDGSDFVDRFFDWPRQRDDAVQWLLDESSAGRTAYFCTHLLTGKQRIKGNAAAVSTLWVEADYAKLPEGFPQPTAVVESSPGRFYYFWKLARPVDPQTAEQLNRRLTAAIGGDSGWALTKLLRPPGTVNYKYPDRPVVELRPMREAAYDVDELDRNVPVLEDGPAVTVDLDGPPIDLTGYGLEVWEGKRPAMKGGRVDTSNTLFHIAAVLYEHGLRRQALIDAIRERDEALGYDKFADRRNGDERYEAIVARIIQKKSAEETPPMAGVTNLAAMIRNGIPDPEFLIGLVLYEEQSHLIFGAPSSGKSWLALHWAAVLISRKQHVLYLDEENRSRRTARRLMALGVDLDLIEEYFHYVDGPGFTMEDESYGRLQSLVNQFNPALVIYDTMISFLSLIGGSENDSSDVGGWWTRFVDTLTRQGMTAVVLDHTGHEGDHPRGSSTKVGKPDVVIRCKVAEPFSPNKDGKVRLSVYQNKDREGLFPATGVYYAIGGDGQGKTTIRFLPTSETDALLINEEKAMTGLQRLTMPAGYNAWYEESGISGKKGFDAARKSLMDKEWVYKTEGGKYDFVK